MELVTNGRWQMKIKIKNRMLIAFLILILGMLVLQFLFSQFLAKDYYIHIKSNTMEAGFDELAKTYDGTIECAECSITI